MRIEKHFSVLLLTLALFSICYAKGKPIDPALTFTEANESYRHGKFEKAIELYHKILDSGYKSKEIFYNLGNAYYRLKEYHQSILFYERALKIDPTDEDIIYNLQVARLQNIDKIDELPKFFLQSWWETVRDLFNSSTWGLLTLIVFWLSVLNFSLFLIVRSITAKKVVFLIGSVFILISLLFATLGYSRFDTETNSKHGIIFSLTSYIKSSPEENSTDLFILHRGTKVEILDEIGNWFKIKIPNGNIGWIPKKDIEII
ncbi:MAG: tetratricopeptide repeat protein [Ignavibacteria bacterium]|nr:tetratricopeptide repeat protein [Ignavibacteria bacterium]